MGHTIFWNISLVLWLLINLIGGKYVMSMPHDHFTIGYTDVGLRKGHLVCYCGESQDVIEKDLNLKTAHRFFREITRDRDFIETMYLFEEIEEFVDCYRCNLTYINCGEEFCIKKVLMFSSRRNENEAETTISTIEMSLNLNETEKNAEKNAAEPTVLKTINVSNLNETNDQETTVLKKGTNLNETSDHEPIVLKNTTTSNETKDHEPIILKNVTTLNETKDHEPTAMQNITNLNETKDGEPTILKNATVLNETKDDVNKSKIDDSGRDKIPDDYVSTVSNFPIESTIWANVTDMNETKDHVNKSETVDEIPSGFVPPAVNIPIDQTIVKNVTNLYGTKDHINNSKPSDDIPAGYGPTLIDIPIGGHKNHSRSRRFVGCSYPTAMQTAAISCRVYPSSIKCIQRCAFGYTLDSGIRKELKCNFKENRWTPSGFKECLPFVDCSVTLSSGGSATCSTSSVDQGPVCEIECLHYEDKLEVPRADYTCKINGTWEPPLPFCAIAGSGIILTSPPRVKLHADS